MKKRMLSLLLTLMIIMGMIPIAPIMASAATIGTVWVGGVEMTAGTFLANGAHTTTTTEPSGGYAYYNNGILTLYNYSYTGEGSNVPTVSDYNAVIYSKYELIIRLMGSNNISATSSTYSVVGIWMTDDLAIYADRDADLTIDSNYIGVYLNQGNLVINGGNINTTGYRSGIRTFTGIITVNGGDITTSGGYGIETNSISVNGGRVEALAVDKPLHIAQYAVMTFGGVTIADGVMGFASTTVNGTLGDYVPENNSNYKHVIIWDMIIISNITYADVTIPVPIVGSMVSDDIADTTVSGEGYEITQISWFYYNDNVDEYLLMGNDDVFESGEQYQCYVKIVALDGYQFPDNKADFGGTVNGKTATVSSNYSTIRTFLIYEVEAVESVAIGDITLLDGDYLWNNATAVTNSPPTNTAIGYAYYSNGTLVMNQYYNGEDTIQFFGDSLTIEVIGNCVAGSIYDGSFPVGTDLGIIPGDLTINTYTNSSLSLWGYAYDTYTALRVYGDITINGGGQVTIVTNDVYSAAVINPKSLTVDGTTVIIYGTNDYAIFGDSTTLTVHNGGTLGLVGTTAAVKECNFTNNEILVSNDLAAEQANCIPWDKTTALDNYKTIWVIASSNPEYLLGDVDGDGDVDADDYILLKRVFFGIAKLENQKSPETAFVRSDVDKNGLIEADDYILLKRVFFGIAKLEK